MSGLGGKEHEEIVNLIRFDAVNLLRMRHGRQYTEVLCMAAEIFMTAALGTSPEGGRSKADRIPDIVLGLPGYSDDGTWLVVEVGRYDPSKWEPNVPVLHVGFNRSVNIINPKGHPFEQDMAGAVRAVLAQQADEKDEKASDRQGCRQ
jgi:hypothetical protein